MVFRKAAVADGAIWRQDMTKAAARPRAKISRAGLTWALVGLVAQHLTVARVAEGLGVAWNTANDAVLAEGKRVLICDQTGFDGVAVIGVDEHVWRHTRRGDSSSPSSSTSPRSGTGPAQHGCWTWSRAAPRPRSRPGSPTAPKCGEAPSKWSRWTGSPDSRPQRPRNSRPRSLSWTLSTSSASPGTP